METLRSRGDARLPELDFCIRRHFWQQGRGTDLLYKGRKWDLQTVLERPQTQPNWAAQEGVSSWPARNWDHAEEQQLGLCSHPCLPAWKQCRHGWIISWNKCSLNNCYWCWDHSLQFGRGQLWSWCGPSQALMMLGLGVIAALTDGPLSPGEIDKSIQKKFRAHVLKTMNLPFKISQKGWITLFSWSQDVHATVEIVVRWFSHTSRPAQWYLLEFCSQIWLIQEMQICSG